jgi:hypothetical protein
MHGDVMGRTTTIRQLQPTSAPKCGRIRASEGLFSKACFEEDTISEAALPLGESATIASRCMRAAKEAEYLC